MTAGTAHFPAVLGGPSAFEPMDAAFDYLLRRGWRVLPLYVVAMAPFSAVMLLVIDSISSEHRSALPASCALLTAATLWRWAWLVAVQRRAQEDVRGEPPLPLRRRLLTILVVRLFSNSAMTWGGILLVPAFFGFFLGGMAAPMALEHDRRAWPLIRSTLGWIGAAAGRLGRVSLILGVLILLMTIGVAVLQALMVGTLLSSLLGLDVEDLKLTMGGSSWTLCVLYLLYLLYDLYWTVLSVMLYYDLQARRLGTDLRARIRALEQTDT
ncbi:MAG: hypothetical protein CMJ18_04370 [Phycisphaeraceae bacterium]|nr:hypothetical protein [Phycisphaeraceae bacterium]